MNRKRVIALSLGICIIGLLTAGIILSSTATPDEDDSCDIKDPDNRT